MDESRSPLGAADLLCVFTAHINYRTHFPLGGAKLIPLTGEKNKYLWPWGGPYGNIYLNTL